MSLKYAILGLLNINPMTGYELKKNFEGPLSGLWYASFGGLYPALHKMVIEELIEVEEKKTARKQKTYHITNSGKEELSIWLLQKTPSPKCNDEYMLKIFLSKDLSDNERLQILFQYLQYKKQMLITLENVLEQVEKKNLIAHNGINIVTKYSVLSLRSEVEAINQIIKDIMDSV